MRKGDATRATILDEAMRQTVTLGLEGLSLGPLAERLNLSKSGLYAHFKSKEALQLAVLEAAVARFNRHVAEPAMKHANGRARLTALFENHLDWIEGDDTLPGCVFVAAIADFDDRQGAVRTYLAEAQAGWRQLLAGTARRAQADGTLDPALDPDQVAFELVGIAHAFHVARRLLEDPEARNRARAAFARALGQRPAARKPTP